MKRLYGWIARLLCLLVTAVFITTAYTVKAQNLYVKVGAQYGVSAADDGRRVSDKYATGQDTTIATLYYAWKHWSYQGMPYATFRQTYLGNAIATDIAWRWEGDDNLRKGFQNTYAFADWTDASGHWMVNRTIQVPRGGMRGQASFGHYNNTQTSQVFATIEFEMDDADWWPANATERRIFESPNSGLDGYNNNSYNESFTIEGFRITGPAKYGDGIKRVGIHIRRPGECSSMDQVYAQMLQIGIRIVGGVPFKFGTLTAFWNELQGVLFEATWGATITGQVISGDSNGELLGVHPGPDGEAGGILDIRILKHEEGILAENPKAPWRGMITLYIEGQYVANFGSVACSNQYVTIDASIIVNPRLRDGQLQGSILTIGGTKGFNYKTTLRNLASGKRWAAPGEYVGRSFKHYAVGDRMIIDDYPTPDPGLPCNCPPLGFFRGNGTFDYVNCLPARTGGTTTNPGPVNPPPPPPPVDPPPPPVTMTATAFKEDCMEAGSVRLPSFMLDGKDNTFWMGCASMTATGSQWVTITLPTAQSLKGLTFTKPIGYNDSWPRTFTVELSANGTSYAAPLKFTGTATGCVATWPVQQVKAARIKCTAANGNYWGVNTLTVQ